MSKELNFQDGNDVLKYQDSSSTLKLYLSENGLPFDLSRLDNITLKVGNDNGYLLEKVVDLSTITDPTSGNLTIPLDGDIMTKLIPDDYNIEIWTQVNPVIYSPEANDVNITIADTGLEDTQAIFPSDGNLVITVDENIKSDPYDTINAYPLDDVWNSIAEWKTDTVNSMTNQLSDQLGTEIRTWQGDIAVSLKNELLNDIATDEGTIRQQLHDILETSLDNLINKEISDLKSSVGEDVHNAMISDVANQIATIKPEITSDLHTDLTNELSSELTTALQNWESSTDNDLNNKLAQAIVDKTTTMQNDLSSELTNYLQGKLNDYETTASQNITNTITQQVTQSIASQFTSEDSQVRTDLENLVKGTIQTDINNTLQQMQENGDIYATKQEFTDFTNTINADLQKLDLANDIGKQISTINNKINTLSPLINGYSQYNANEFGTDFNAYVTPGFYTVNNMQNNLPNGLTQGIVQVGYYDSSNDVTQLFWDNQGNVYNRGESQGSWNAWLRIATSNDVTNLTNTINNVNNKAFQYQGKVSNFNSAVTPGFYKYSDGTISSTIDVKQYYDVIIQTRIDTWDTKGLTWNDDDYAPKMRLSADGGNTWTPWNELATSVDIAGINQTLATKANQTDLQSLANNVGNNVASSMATLESSVSANSSAIASNANSASSAISSNASQIDYNANRLDDLIKHHYGNYGWLPTNVKNLDDMLNVVDGIYSSWNSSNTPVIYPNQGNQWGVIIKSSYSIIFHGMGNNYLYTAMKTNGSWSWKQIANYDDINNVQTAINQVQNNVNSLQNSALYFKQDLPSSSDLNGVKSPGIYWFHGFIPINGPSSSGAVGTLIVTLTGDCITQIITNVFTNNFFIRTGNTAGSFSAWSNMITTANNPMIFQSDIPSGATLANLTTTGYYNLAGSSFADGPISGNIWGQMTVLTSGGVTNQTIMDNGGNQYHRTINTWGTTQWVTQANVIIAQNAQQAQSINAPANTIVISEN